MADTFAALTATDRAMDRLADAVREIANHQDAIDAIPGAGHECAHAVDCLREARAALERVNAMLDRVWREGGCK